MTMYIYRNGTKIFKEMYYIGFTTCINDPLQDVWVVLLREYINTHVCRCCLALQERDASGLLNVARRIRGRTHR